ncbi:MAG: hypothetical protein IJ163_10880, partial [Bacteroidaceae bacterium]|nr:hypothetical protein [Bacteroidaceae bacterium]
CGRMEPCGRLLTMRTAFCHADGGSHADSFWPYGWMEPCGRMGLTSVLLVVFLFFEGAVGVDGKPDSGERKEEGDKVPGDVVEDNTDVYAHSHAYKAEESRYAEHDFSEFTHDFRL